MAVGAAPAALRAALGATLLGRIPLGMAPVALLLAVRDQGAPTPAAPLVRDAALEAIINGSEAITRKILETIEVDQTAEDARQEHRRNRRPRRRRPDADAA
ncbi:hypothetical protein [Streptomyces sp. NPDC001970]